MKTRNLLLLGLLAGGLACGGGSTTPDPDPIPDPTPDAGPTVNECDEAANVARRDALLAAQPVLGVRTKAVLTLAVTFPSARAGSSATCPVTLKFKDLDASGALDAYEDWRLAPAARAADLAGRMSAAQKVGLLAHPTLTDAPTATNLAVSTATKALVEASHVRFGMTAANAAQPQHRATWANNLQALAEAAPLGVPFVLSTEPALSAGAGRTLARGFNQWPHELGLVAAGDPAAAETYGRYAGQALRAIGVRMALSPSADLLTDPRLGTGVSALGEDSATVSAFVAAYIKGFQGASLGPTSVATVARGFPGSGAAKGGLDARLEKGKLVSYSGTTIDQHLAAFQKAAEAGVTAVMPGYGIPEAGSWSGLGGALSGTGIEQVGAPFHKALLTDVLRGRYGFDRLVLAPWGALESKGTDPLGAPWGVEGLTRVQRAAKAMGAGVDQFGGLADPGLLTEARTAGLVTDAQVDASARRALTLLFQLGLFEDPYVDATTAARTVGTSNNDAYTASLDLMGKATVLVVNQPKPAGWLNGKGDGTQTADKANAGNGSLKVLPAPPGEPYVSAGCRYFVHGNFNLDYVRSVSAGYGELTNDANSINDRAVSTPEERIALSDYVFVRIDAPFTADADSGPLALPTPSLEYAGAANAAALADVKFVRDAIDAWNAGKATTDPLYSKAQIVVLVDAGRPPVVSEILQHGVSGLYLVWSASDKVVMDTAFGIVNGRGVLPAGLPLSDAAASTQAPDVAGDGQHGTFVKGFGLQTNVF